MNWYIGCKRLTETDAARFRTPWFAARCFREEKRILHDRICRTGPVRGSPRRRRAHGLRLPHARSGAVHPLHPGRPRRHRRRFHRHRQDRSVPAAHALHARAHERPRPRPARVRRQPHARAGSADQPHLHADLPQNRPLRDHRLRRHALRPADPRAARRHRRAHRHARPSERPDGPRRRRSIRDEGARARRGRPHA